MTETATEPIVLPLQPVIEASIPPKPNNQGVPSSYAGYPGLFYTDPITKVSKKSVTSRFIETLSYVGQSKIHGLGAFAKVNIPSGQLIEEVSAIILDTTTKYNKDYVITRYLFTWPCDHNDPICDEHGSTFMVPTGNAMIYNHSDNPNSYWIYDKAMKRLFFSALRDIAEGEELTWYYGHGYAERLRMDPTGEGQERNGGGCSSCQERQNQQAQQAQQQKPTRMPNRLNKNTSNVNRSTLFSNIHTNTTPVNNDITPKVNQDTSSNESIEFRSMVVPENKINDTIQDGSV